MAELLCPKCQAPMRSYERNGVTIERCTECRGIFLDAGELERLMAAEAGIGREQAFARSGYESHGRDHEREHDYEHDSQRSRHRRGSFLADLLSGGGGDD